MKGSQRGVASKCEILICSVEDCPPSLPAGSSPNAQHYELQSLVNKSNYDETKVVWNHDKQLIEDLCNKLISNLQKVQSVSAREVMLPRCYSRI